MLGTERTRHKETVEVSRGSVKQNFIEHDEELGFYSVCNGKLLKAIRKLVKEPKDLIHGKNKKP